MSETTFTPETKAPISSPDDFYKFVWANGGNNPPTIVFHEDGGHGWLQIPKKMAKELNITGISGYSYEDQTNFYLEEDCDLSLAFIALGIGRKDNETPEMYELRQEFWKYVPREYTDDSPIRNKKHISE